MPKISIIVPVYNAEKTISQCVESVLQQTHSDWELILVNDGSSDKSADICEKYKNADRRIQVIHKQNGGASSARNMGIASASGEYISFIDSDDYIDRNTLEIAVKMIQDMPSTLLVYGMTYDFFDGDVFVESQRAPDNKPLPFQETNIALWEKAFSKINMASPCNKLYESRLIKANNLEFDPTCAFYEDLKFNLDYCRHVKAIIAITDGLYHYRQTEIPQITKRKFKEVFANSDSVYDSLEPYIIQSAKKETIFDNIAFQTYYLEMRAHLLQQKNAAEIMRLLFTNPQFLHTLKRIKKGKQILVLQALCTMRAYKLAGWLARKFVRAK